MSSSAVVTIDAAVGHAVPEEEQEEENQQADEIAKQLTAILIKGFESKMGRAPTNAEIQQLLEEITPERIGEILGQEIPLVEGDDEDGDDEDSDENYEDEADDEQAGEANEEAGEAEEGNNGEIASQVKIVVPEGKEEDEEDEKGPVEKENKRIVSTAAEGAVEVPEQKRIRVE